MITDTSAEPGSATLYTPGQKDVLQQLRALQQQLGLTDAAFVREHLTVSATVWSRLNSGTYPADATSALVRLETNLRQLRVKLAKNAKLTGGRLFHHFAQQKAVIEAVTTCKLKPADDPNRFVGYLAPTGGGKTALGRELKVMHDGIYVEARESWRKSYFAALVDIGAAAECDMTEMSKGERFAEAEVLRRFCSNRRVLIIDEGEYFGPRTINLVKMLLNQTPTVVVLLAIPELFDRWQRASWQEARQINRRAEAIVELELITPAEVETFLVAQFSCGSATTWWRVWSTSSPPPARPM
jgi:hypothetical protein